MSEITIEQLPAIPADVTVEWLGSKLGHKIKSIENTRNVWGTASKLFYTITYEDESTEDRPEHICIKGVFDPKLIEAQPWTVSLAQREADFFSKVAPTVTKMLFPKSWWSGTSDKQGIAIMTDLSKEGSTFPAEVATYSVDQVKNGVEQLASLHAAYWGQSQEDHPWIWNNYDPAMKFMCVPWNEVVRQPGRPKLPDHLMDGERCNEAVDRYYAERNPRFRTLLHGDTHLGNIYFTTDGRTGFLDWSAFHFGSCFHDVVYHMTSVLSIEDRRAHEMEILDHYLAALHRLGGPKFDRHNDPEVMIEYRRSFMTNVIWIICPDGLQSKERVDLLCERSAAAYSDHKVIDVILGQPKPKPAA
ncbi:aminoglycoside phosphotransferase [Grosmannia clavigera kw1407]|uniref:Aminoglycoside phosphotransferase n=1 Tax=Grosmannia clavigera (strain kw1407 / UAMH 11150) TaxID=655863 RepID=F0XB66_GROCL|nr:aminoglycoside phosphotransferase [Grosmannia clavigera kw1407]EFX04963.1 aminoglycoside phosphotransferase [Grosmannia clavigera kw1407]